jgi:hypothetical protein
VALVALMSMVAVSFLSVLLTMKEVRADTVRGALVFKVVGLNLLFGVPVALFATVYR